MTSTYTDAAFEVLARHGNPLHYAVIAKAAIELGILHRNSKNSEIVFSSTLSRAAKTADGPFRRTAPGVYQLAGEFSVSNIKSAAECATRLEILCRKSGVRDRLKLVTKGLFVLRNSLAVAGPRFIIEIGEGAVPFRLKPAISHRLPFVNHALSFPLTLELVRAAAPLRVMLEAREVLHVFALSLALLEASLKYASGSAVLLRADGKERNIQLF